MSITHDGKDQEETRDLVAEFLAKGGKITKIPSRSMAEELGVSNNVWGKKLTKGQREIRALEAKETKEREERYALEAKEKEDNED